MSVTLRPYQSDAIQSTYDWLAANEGNPLVVMPTGTGKSVVLGGIVRDAKTQYPDTRILILSHVRELLTQDFATLLRLWPEAPAGIYSAGLNRREINAEILVAGIQSIHKHAYKVQRCDLVFIDEAHLIGNSDAGMYRRFLKDLRDINPYVRVIGLTATPYRMQTGLLHEGDDALFSGISYQVQILDMVRDGYLCPVIAKATATKLDTSGVGTRGGEFIAAQLEAAVDIDEVTQAAVLEVVKAGQDRGSWVAFCSGVRHAEHVRDAIRAHGFTCETVTGETPTVQRDRIINDFRDGKIRCLTNMNTLTTGIDVPGIDLIAMLRPTKSLSLYVQMLGRGMRLADGKDECIVLDFAGCTRLHGPIDMADGRRKKKIGDGIPPTKDCPICQSIVPAGTRFCPDCGHEFPPPEVKIDAVASDAPVLSIHARPPEWITVSDASYSLHTKPDKPVSLLATYRCGLIWHKEWVCFEHTGYPRQKAVDWWQRRMFSQPVPDTSAEALRKAADLPTPAAIQVRSDGKYVSVTGVRFG